MRIFPLTFALLFAAASVATAQLTVEVLLDDLEFLRDESLTLRVRVTNRSGQPLRLGQSNDWLSFTVEGQDGSAVPRLAEPRVAGAFTLDSAQSATKTVDIMPGFDFGQPGRFTVTATVKVPQWDGEITSPRKSFHIIRGTRLWEEEFGVPVKEGAPEMRKYSLVRASGLKHSRLCVRVTDPQENRVFRVVSLGQAVSFGHPEARVDRASTLHVLFQNGARTFLYCAFDPQGEWIARQSFDYTTSRPTLRVNPAGRVVVEGGARRYTPADLPPSANMALTDPTSAPPIAPIAPTPTPLKDDKRSKP